MGGYQNDDDYNNYNHINGGDINDNYDNNEDYTNLDEAVHDINNYNVNDASENLNKNVNNDYKHPFNFQDNQRHVVISPTSSFNFNTNKKSTSILIDLDPSQIQNKTNSINKNIDNRSLSP